MKHLFFTLIILLNWSMLTAQDTLYVKGKKEPLLVEILVVKNKTLNYTPFGVKGLRTISLKKVRKIRFDNDNKVEEKVEKPALPIVETEEFRSTALVQLSGVIFQNQIGVAYMHRISPAIVKRRSYWMQVGGGYLGQQTLRRVTKGYYIEIGAMAEIISRKNPQNRFSIGLDANHQWTEGTESSGGGLFSGGTQRAVSDSRLAFEVPIGYTYRGEKGLYVNAGLEISTYLIVPSVMFRIGYTFGK